MRSRLGGRYARHRNVEGVAKRVADAGRGTTHAKDFVRTRPKLRGLRFFKAICSDLIRGLFKHTGRIGARESSKPRNPA